MKNQVLPKRQPVHARTRMYFKAILAEAADVALDWTETEPLLTRSQIDEHGELALEFAVTREVDGSRQRISYMRRREPHSLQDILVSPTDFASFEVRIQMMRAFRDRLGETAP